MIPASTYRLQLTRDFGFADARRLVPYLDELGITDVYLSPIFRAKTGSPHGYDVTDPTVVSHELGGEGELRALSAELRARGMGLVIDIVPNHMAASIETPWWNDVLEKGQRSRFARVFDIDWSRGPVVLPILGGPFGKVLEDGELVFVRDDRGPAVKYWEHRFPLDPRTLGRTDVRALAGKKGEPRSWDRLEQLLDRQAFRLAWWRTGSRAISYRRFFDINDLVGVRVEDPEVFELTHSLVARLVREGVVTGLRVDHVDGLRDPRGYLDRLHALGCDWLVVEKILTGDERLPREWPVAGSTGYDFLKVANGIFADDHGVKALEELTARFAGISAPFDALVFASKKRMLEELFPGELESLSRELVGFARADRWGRDIATKSLEQALAFVTASLPVYRTYVDDAVVSGRDHEVVETALREATSRGRKLDPAALDFLRRVLLVERREWTPFVQRWQQLTGPVMAKGLEDTALYVYTRLLSLNDVGARRSRARSLEEFHAFNRDRRASHPGTMSATSTHDTKRSEDVRLRIHVLSELATEWGQRVPRWSRLNRPHRTKVHDRLVPDANEEMLLYQTLVGAWPLEGGPVPTKAFRERIEGYVVKAAREAKVHTSWVTPDTQHEAALVSFVRAILASTRFLEDFRPFQEEVAWYGHLNGLAQVILKVASPGVSDFYQGTELWTHSLVDPDNRRPVDFTKRRASLAREPSLETLLESWRDGRLKLFVTARALRARREERELFLEGDYQPLVAPGKWRDHVCAFARRSGTRWCVAVVPRLMASLVSQDVLPVRELWGDATLALPREAPATWRDAITGERVARVGRGLRLAQVFSRLGVALLVSE